VATLPLVLAAGAGFLIAVLWFDLMFDVQVRRLDEADGEARLGSIADYYRRVTIEAYPANRLVAAVMLVVVAGTLTQLVTGAGGRGRALLALVCAGSAIGLAGARVVPNAMRLGARRDPPAVQRELARGIWRDHVVCLIAMVAFLALQLGR
jgi:hypothetical protein